MSGLFLGKTKVGLNHKPFIIAEMSGNHNQSLERALSIVEAAANARVDAVKLQTYTADTITLNAIKKDFIVSSNKSLWKGNYLYDLYKQAYTPWEWHQEIFKKCKKLGLYGFSTPFDETAVDYLEKLNVPFYKVASFENVHLPLLKKIARTGKPVIMSTGMSNIRELAEAVETLRNNGCTQLILLKCTSAYPADPKDINLHTIPHLRNLFNCEIGLSDHTMGIGVTIASIALGATVIEKHVTLKRADGGVDSAFSMEPEEMAQLVKEAKIAWESLGQVRYANVENEEREKKFRRSIYIAQDMKKGEVFTQENLRVVRPGLGMEPKYYEMMLGKKILKRAAKGTPLSWDLVLSNHETKH